MKAPAAGHLVDLDVHLHQCFVRPASDGDLTTYTMIHQTTEVVYLCVQQQSRCLETLRPRRDDVQAHETDAAVRK